MHSSMRACLEASIVSLEEHDASAFQLFLHWLHVVDKLDGFFSSGCFSSEFSRSGFSSSGLFSRGFSSSGFFSSGCSSSAWGTRRSCIADVLKMRVSLLGLRISKAFCFRTFSIAMLLVLCPSCRLTVVSVACHLESCRASCLYPSRNWGLFSRTAAEKRCSFPHVFVRCMSRRRGVINPGVIMPVVILFVSCPRSKSTFCSLLNEAVLS